MYKLIACDLDGTLLSAEHRLGEYTVHVLSRLREQGTEIVLASGRHFIDIRRFSSLLGGDGFLVSSNGAAVHNPRGQLTLARPIDPSCLEFLLLDPLFDQVHTNVCRADDWLVETPKPPLLRYHQESGFAYRVVDFARLGDDPVLKVFYYHEDVDHLERLEARILERYGDRLRTTYSLPIVLEVMAPGTSKGDALADIARQLDIPTKEILAFGDGRNDVEMLRFAGKGVLMANSAPWLKAALPDFEVIGANANEAIAHYLARFLSTPI